MRNFLMSISKFVLAKAATNDSTGDIKDLGSIAARLQGLIKQIVAPIVAVVGVVGIIYAVYLGVLYAKAESADKRKEVQGRLVGACIGALIMIVGATLGFALDWKTIMLGFIGS